MMGNTPLSSRDVQVHVHHERREGYPPSRDGQDIQERLSLREFITRIFKDDHSVERELYRTHKCLSGTIHGHSKELEVLSDSYNTMYIELFRSGKTVLPQHTMSHQMVTGIDPYQNRKDMDASDLYRRQMLQSQAYFTPTGTSFAGQFGGVASGLANDNRLKDMAEEATKKEIFEAAVKLTEKEKRDADIYYLLS